MVSAFVMASCGSVVEVSEPAAASSGVLRHLPRCDACEPQACLPFGASCIREWVAGAPEDLASFQQVVQVLRVRAPPGAEEHAQALASTLLVVYQMGFGAQAMRAADAHASWQPA